MTQANLRSSIMPQPIISAQQITQSIQLPHQNLTILKEVNLQIMPGEQVAITGRSGSGKSTLLGILATLDQASSGELIICEEEVHRLNEEQRAQVRLKYIGFIFQSFQLLPALTAVENVMLPLRLQPDFHYQTAEQKALKLLKRVGLERQAGQTPKVLSGGEQQRVAIARALISEPAIIFADEPTGNLDGQTAEEIEQLLFELNHELGTTLVLVTHDPELARQCQRHFELVNGHLIEKTSGDTHVKSGA
ncbi:ABC transporter ATP-binding protein [Acinetobacter radioresistens]|jgi:putative ABC transport system ATP-binding protein|uniref:ABC transporter ATP-binding protein n=1 Tax=Acinetobacter radioresistens TaxID=40216 RepID=A0A3D3G3F3_ACIRA|nr:ABC transporter ATP-binding protein [Acinetobacter radioresistens]AWV86948.1 ABC transporter ATP-binding protein [Acinetobacter radioresistens]MCK4085870.1 ABC transporter ATP-binding protein [Acinetobacter radioresistens]MCK4088996.1 ABC transporter ATP-binding protein [Acinetobacter radioresistens]MCK4108521.1 ABC transporter ATP-binding protein [Acinetobacter radioresistens]MCX0327841.1 ABC transporter ATP-binding protein [Acinetobacter radioresistens]